MILYNVTAIVDEEIHGDWLNWMREEHIRDVMNTECFVSNRLLKVLDSPNEGTTYCIQYIAENKQNYDNYIKNFAPVLRNSFPERFNNKFVIFRTLMEVID